MKRKRNGEGGFNSFIAEKVEVVLPEQVKTKFFKGKVVLPEDFEKEMKFSHRCDSDAREILRINNSDSHDLAILVANSDMIPFSRAQKLVQDFC